MSPATALVPEMETRTVRLVSSVRPPLVRVPVIVPTSSVTDVIEGAPGSVASTVIAAAFCDGVTVTLPARSVWRTRTAPAS